MNKKFYYTQGCKELRDFINSIGITYVSGDISRYGYYFDGENIVHDNLSLLHGMSNYICLELDEFIEYIKNVLNIEEVKEEEEEEAIKFYAIMVDGKQTPAMLYDSIEEARELAKKMALKELRTTYILQCIERVEILTETIKM
jgi:hypothetical protein